jgi:hypothetical protein
MVPAEILPFEILSGWNYLGAARWFMWETITHHLN